MTRVTRLRTSGIRGWVAAHDGVPVLIAIAAVSIGTVLYAGRTVRGLDEQRIPLWFLAPALLAMVTALATGDRLPTLAPRRTRPMLARAWWAAAMSTAACGGALAIGVSADQPGLVVVTAPLVGLTWMLAVVVGRASVLLGAGACVLVLVRTRDLADLTPREVLADLGAWGVVIGLGLGVAGVVVHGLAPRPGDRDRLL